MLQVAGIRVLQGLVWEISIVLLFVPSEIDPKGEIEVEGGERGLCGFGRETAKGGGREQHERTPIVDSWTSDLCVSVGGMSSIGRCYTCAESKLSQLERQKRTWEITERMEKIVL